VNPEPLSESAYKRARAELSRKLDVWAACEAVWGAGLSNLVPEMSEALGVPEILKKLADLKDDEINLAIGMGNSRHDPMDYKIRSAMLEVLRKFLVAEAKRYGHCPGKESKPLKVVLSHKDVPHEFGIWAEMEEILPLEVAVAARKVRPRAGKWQGMGYDRERWNEWRGMRRHRKLVEDWLSERSRFNMGHESYAEFTIF